MRPKTYAALKGAHCADCDTEPDNGSPTTWASMTSISGADRPTNVPSECIGPGCDSPAHVHLDRRCPGKNERAPPTDPSPLTVALRKEYHLSDQR